MDTVNNYVSPAVRIAQCNNVCSVGCTIQCVAGSASCVLLCVADGPLGFADAAGFGAVTVVGLGTDKLSGATANAGVNAW